MTLDDEGWVDRFVAQAPPIDDVREEAARCAEETAKAERGERPPLRTLLNGPAILAEFSDAAAGTAAEVAMQVGEAMKRVRVKWSAAFAWDLAAKLLRGGWQRGHRLESHVVKEAKGRS